MLDSSPEIILSFDNIRTTRAQKFMSNVLIKQIHMYCFNPREKHNHKKHNHKIIINPGGQIKPWKPPENSHQCRNCHGFGAIKINLAVGHSQTVWEVSQERGGFWIFW